MYGRGVAQIHIGVAPMSGSVTLKIPCHGLCIRMTDYRHSDTDCFLLRVRKGKNTQYNGTLVRYKRVSLSLLYHRIRNLDSIMIK